MSKHMTMEEVRAAEERLLEALRESPVLLRFEEAKKQLEGHEEEKQVIDAFRQKAYQLSNTSDPIGALDDVAKLYEERSRVYENPRMAEYLQAEMEVCRMLQLICTHVMEVTDLQIEPFEQSIMT